MATEALHPRPGRVACPDANITQPSARPFAVDAPWYDAPEFRALAAARRAFILGGIPPATVQTPEAAARHAAYWTLYELGHALDEIERRTREGSPCWSRVRVAEHGPGRIVIDIAIEPPPGAATGGGA